MLEGGRYYKCADSGPLGPKSKTCTDVKTKAAWVALNANKAMLCCWKCETKCQYECGRKKPVIIKDEYRPQNKYSNLRPGYHYRKK